jgi:hypothetical protein
VPTWPVDSFTPGEEQANNGPFNRHPSDLIRCNVFYRRNRFRQYPAACHKKLHSTCPRSYLQNSQERPYPSCRNSITNGISSCP